MTRTLIQGASVYDGTGGRPFTADVLVGGETIEAVGKLEPQPGWQVVPAAGLALSPGFINTHSHMELAPFKDPAMASAIGQGITTETLGQDGSSVAPLNDGILQQLMDNMAPLAGVPNAPYPWRSFAEYMHMARQAGPAARLVSLVGHGTLRMNAMGEENRPPSAEELAQMKSLLAECMEQGAKGLSYGLIYPPGSYGATDELAEMAKVVARYDGIIMVHTRNENNQLLESLEEMVTVMQQSGARLQISHLKALGKPNWGKVAKARQRIEQLNDEGWDITFDQYPWTAACTGLKVCLPQWAFEGGEQAFQARLARPQERADILAATEAEVAMRGGGECILIASVASEEYAWMAGKKMDEIAARLGLPVAEAVLHILQHEGPAVIAIYFSISEEDVALAMKSRYHSVCTDGIMGAHPHPRTYASFPRFLGRYVREQQAMPLEEAIRHITMEPARRLRLWDRGILRPGLSADLVLFDPATIIDVNSYMEPATPPVGIEGVWVQGQRRL